MVNIPKITVVTPSFNQGHFIEATILSVLGQHYPNLEYIIMDGGSTDNSVDVIKKYDKEVSYWESVKDNGQAHAINKGFSRSTGDILMWLNSDDMLMPNVLNLIAHTFKENGDKLYFGNCIHFREEKGTWSAGSDVLSRYKNDKIEQIAYIIQPSSFWTKHIWQKVGLLNEDMHFVFDWEWFIRVKQNQIPFYPMNTPISLYRYHSDHKSGTGGKKRQLEILKVLQEYSVNDAELYAILMDEIDSNLSFSNKVFRFFYKKTHKTFDYAESLMYIKPYKYKKYKIEEISRMVSML